MMNRTLPLFLALGVAVAACGRPESGDAAYEGSRPNRSEAAPPAPTAAEGPALPAPADPGASEPRGSAAPDAGPANPAVPATGRPAAPGQAQGSAAPANEAPAAAPANEAEAILRRVEQAYANVRSMEADFVQQLTVPLLGSSQRSEGKMYQKRPDRFLMRFTDPAGDVMVADGSHFWMYTPSVDRTQVIRARMGDGGAQFDLQQEFIANPTRRYVATLAGSETVNGRATDLITLVPRGSSPYRLIQIWVDREDHLVRRFEMTEENESVRRIELRNLRINRDLPDSLFQFAPPAGTQVFTQ